MLGMAHHLYTTGKKVQKIANNLNLFLGKREIKIMLNLKNLNGGMR